MSEGNAGAQSRLQEIRSSMEDLRSALRRARTMRILATLVGVVIAVLYICFFLSFITRSFEATRVSKAVEMQLEDEDFKAALDRMYMSVRREIFPEVLKAIEDKLTELELGGVVATEIPRLAAKVLPVFVEEAAAKAAEMELTPILADEFGKLMVDVGPVYLTEARDMMDELNLMSLFAEGMKEQSARLSEAYRAELRRIAPEVLDAVRAQQQDLAGELSQYLEKRIAGQVQSSLSRNAAYIQQETDLTPEAVEEKLASIVIAAEEALKGVVKERTDVFQEDLDAINSMLNEVPLCSQRDPTWLENEMGHVLIQLLKEKLPTYESPLEWEEGE